MHRNLIFIGLVAILVSATGARAVDVEISAKIGLVKAGKLAKLVSKDASLVTLPTAGSGNDPTLVGAQVQIFDTIPGGGGSFTHLLDKTGWKGLGNPAGSKGYKYTGSKASPPDTLCTSVQVKPGKAKVKCKTVPGLSTPFLGLDGIILGIPAGPSPALRYCAALGGTTKKNDATELKRKDAPAPGSCPFVAPTPTVTSTRTVTNMATATNTPANTATRTATNTPANTATATNTPANTATRTNSPTPTNTPIVCPLTAGRYIQTTTGGSLTVSTFAPFAFPAGGKTVQDVSAGDANCVHTTVVPYPGTCTGSTCTAGNTGASCTTNADCNGLTVPVFCVPALGYTVQVTQTACGVGEIDSNGGSDFTVTENGDTSYGPLNGCSAHQTTCASGQDSSGDIDITVGDGTADTCSSGTANAIVSIPVHTLTWLAADKACVGGTHNGMACTTVTNCPKACVGGTNNGLVCTTVANCPGGSCPTTTCTNACPDLDGVYNAGTDTLITQFPQTLDLTTDTNTAQFIDNDGDTCSLSGAGPAGPTANSGACIDISGQTVSVAGSGTVFSSGAPLFDLLFTTEQDATIAGPTASGGATCGVPPVINFTGLAHRCIIAP